MRSSRDGRVSVGGSDALSPHAPGQRQEIAIAHDNARLILDRDPWGPALPPSSTCSAATKRPIPARRLIPVNREYNQEFRRIGHPTADLF